MPSSIQHLKNAEQPLESFIRDPCWLDTLLLEVPCGRHEPTKFFEHLKRGLPHIYGLKPIVFPGLIAIIPTGDDLTGKILEIVGTVAVWGVLHGVLCSELLHCEVGEAVEPVEDTECYQGLHRVRVQLRKADIQVQ